MTLKQINGSKLILIIFILSLSSSCKSIKEYRKYNYFNGSEFYNDTLNISGRFFGDIKYYNPIKNEIKKNIKGIRPINYKNLLVHGKALSSPKYNVYLFYKTNFNETLSKEKNINDTLLLNDIENNLVLYRKTLDNKAIFVLLKSIGISNSNLSILQDGKSIINSMKFDNSIKDELTYMKIFNTYKEESNILYVMNKFDKAPIRKTKKNEWMKFQLLATILSKDNEYYRYEKLIEKFEIGKKAYLSNVIKEIKDLSVNDSAIKEISKISKNERVVMLNEMHWKPEHRIFASKLLIPLKKNGYKYLAIEAVDKEQDSLLNIRKYPIKSTGYYTSEPNFGLFIREAISLGYRIIGYDDFSTDDREKAQALNIATIFDKDPNAKVFVYAGIDHILEKSKSNSIRRMAEIFKEKTGINPLTIDQVELVANTNNKLTLLKSNLLIKDKKINTNVDFFIINNIENSFNTFFKNNTVSFSIQDKSLIKYNEQEVLISLYFQDEYEKHKSSSIPLLNRIKQVKNNQINVLLPIGKYHLVIKDVENNRILSSIIDVK